jgi:SnoaL-like domain
MAESIAGRTAARYAAALAENRAEDVLALFGDRPHFHSPFSVWATPETVRAACAARAIAFADVTVVHLLADDDHAAVLWRATVRGKPVEGCEVLTLAGGAVDQVHVYLRPAAALPTVFAAMSSAWPR